MTVFNINGLPFNAFRGGAFDPLRKRNRGEMDYTRLIEFYIEHCTEINPSTGKTWTLAQMADENGQTFNRMHKYVGKKLRKISVPKMMKLVAEIEELKTSLEELEV